MQSALPKDIKAFVMDVDGVLTDGRIGYGCGSQDEIKFFDVKDGMGIRLLRAAGITTAIISGRKSLANEKRAKELGIDVLVEGCKKKRDALEQLCRKLGITPEQCLYIGDDLNDLEVVGMAGIGVAVGDAVEEVKNAAKWNMTKCGGRGAVREAAEKLLKDMKLWDKALQDVL